MNVWNQVLDSQGDGARANGGGEAKKKKEESKSFEELEREMIRDITSSSGSGCAIPSKTCPACGGPNVELAESVTGRRNVDASMTKGEVWGRKDAGGDAAEERCHCVDCGKTWNE